MNELEKLLISNKPVKCEVCGGKMFYIGGGRYQCDACNNIEMDDFGRIKEFLDQNGPSPIMAISMATGVKTEVIKLFLKKGRIEIPEGSKYYLKCEKCGCSIRYGRFCPECVRAVAGDMQAIFSEDVGERPKTELNPTMAGKMHYFKNRRDTR